MAWIEPVTDRGRTAYCTYEDLNRICGNINHLTNFSLPASYTTYNFLSKEDFTQIVNGCISMCNMYGIKYVTKPNLDTTWTNFNNIESLTLLCYERLQLWQKQEKSNTAVNDQYARYVGAIGNYSVRGGGL